MFNNGQLVEVGSDKIVNTSIYASFNQSKCQEEDVLVWKALSSSLSSLGEIQCQSRNKKEKVFCLSGIICGKTKLYLKNIFIEKHICMYVCIYLDLVSINTFVNEKY